MTGETVYETLEEDIILGRLKPRERLPESALCRRLGISRTLLREVFRRLEGAGLVTLQPNRGVVVRDFSPQEIDDVYYLRTVLERAAIPLIIQRVRPEDLLALRELAAKFEAACRRNSMPVMILCNLAFHRRLARICGNAFLCQSLELSHLQTHQIRYVAWLSDARVQRSIREHRTIIGALARRDAAALRRIVLTHLSAGRADYRRIFPIGDESRHDGGPRIPRTGRTGKEGSHA
jgi:DNA-binding GntR family transcriptional regulator